MAVKIISIFFEEIFRVLPLGLQWLKKKIDVIEIDSLFRYFFFFSFFLFVVLFYQILLLQAENVELVAKLNESKIRCEDLIDKCNKLSVTVTGLTAKVDVLNTSRENLTYWIIGLCVAIVVCGIVVYIIKRGSQGEADRWFWEFWIASRQKAEIKRTEALLTRQHMDYKASLHGDMSRNTNRLVTGLDLHKKSVDKSFDAANTEIKKISGFTEQTLGYTKSLVTNENGRYVDICGRIRESHLNIMQKIEDLLKVQSENHRLFLEFQNKLEKINNIIGISSHGAGASVIESTSALSLSKVAEAAVPKVAEAVVPKIAEAAVSKVLPEVAEVLDEMISSIS